MTTVLIVLLLALGAYLVAVLEAWVSNGHFKLAAPLFAGIALLGRESIVPRKPDRIFLDRKSVV